MSTAADGDGDDDDNGYDDLLWLCYFRLQWNEITNISIELLAKALMKNVALKVNRRRKIY